MPEYFKQSVFQPVIPKHFLSEEDLAFIKKFGVTAEDYFYDKTRLYFCAEDYFCHWPDTRPDGTEFERTVEDDLYPRFQEIIQRSNGELLWISIESAFTCDRMMPDGFGGSAVFITADDIQHFGTSSWLEQRIGEAETGDIGPHTEDMPSAKPILGVVIEGGLVQAVVSNDPTQFPVDTAVIIDYDTEGADDENLYDVPQSNGNTVQVYASISMFDKSGIDLENVVSQIRGRN